jgi:hypothetical protein
MSVRGPHSECGCCEGLQYRTPVRLFNRPGLSEIAYRMGSYGRFKQSMLAGLTHAGRPSLASHQTRSADDFSIALIDAWAVAGDVLTFYIERTAQEHYLPTATERRSIDEMGRLISYRLRPGVAASTWLAFTLESSPDPDNDMRPKASQGVPERTTIHDGVQVQSVPGPEEDPQTFETVEAIEAHVDWNWLQPQQVETAYPAEDQTHAWLDGIGLDLSRGDVLLVVSAEDENEWELVRVTRVVLDAENRRTRVEWHGGLKQFAEKNGAKPVVEVYAMRQRGALFGFNAPDPSLFHEDVRDGLPVEEISTNGATVFEWEFAEIAGSTLFLDVTYPAIDPEGFCVLRNPANNNAERLTRVTSVDEVSKSGYALSAKVTRLIVAAGDAELLAFGGEHTRGTIIHLGSERLTLAEYPIEEPVNGDSITLSHDLTPMELPRNAVIRGEAAPGDPGDAELGEPVAEPIVIVDVASDGTRATLTLAKELRHHYKRTTVELLGNVAKATHGETVEQEVLGSGDGSRPYQQFTLKKKSLTYVRGGKPGELESTLKVYVNGVRWREVPSFFEQGPHARVYTTRINDEGETTVQFGDGDDGARLPTGEGNVHVTYRHGSGPEGHLAAGQLSLLMTRPLAVRAAENPIAPSGAAERQSADDARENAPRSVVTLERIVSLRDYEDFARDFPGIEKAAAVWTWNGERRGVLITVAGSDGEVILPGSAVHDDLKNAIIANSPGRVPIEIKSHRPIHFGLRASIGVDPDYDKENVLAAVRKMLLERLSFRARSFGQMVKKSDVYAAIHAIEGVTAAHITALYRGEVPQLEPFLIADAPLNGTPPETEGAELLVLSPDLFDELELMS